MLGYIAIVHGCFTPAREAQRRAAYLSASIVTADGEHQNRLQELYTQAAEEFDRAGLKRLQASQNQPPPRAQGHDYDIEDAERKLTQAGHLDAALCASALNVREAYFSA